ncbi:DUF397 domain-containing protein [Streptomyces apocyni]|uniref:DUF397 domain-containing protein n=1 Tax=Streptomyces apocyni TaxID=2654677 RepID=UPI0012E9A0C7|nr:DUF397 domain-containing protein [Streptomyces apocyni]
MPVRSWQKSSYCQEGDACVHIATPHAGTIQVTESADPTRSILSTTPHAFTALLRTLKETRPHGC